MKGSHDRAMEAFIPTVSYMEENQKQENVQKAVGRTHFLDIQIEGTRYVLYSSRLLNFCFAVQNLTTSLLAPRHLAVCICSFLS